MNIKELTKKISNLNLKNQPCLFKSRKDRDGKPVESVMFLKILSCLETI